MRSLRGSLATYPFAALFAVAYAWWKPGVGMIEFQLVMLFSFVAMLPNILLQGAFIVLSLAGKHATINSIYLLSAAALILLCAGLFFVPSIWVFLCAVAFANILRWLLLERSAGSVIADEPPPHDYAGTETSAA